MSEFGSPSDGSSFNSNSRFELAMLESSGPLLESCTKNSRLGDLRNCQTLANIGSSSFMSVGEGVVCDAIPIFRSEFTADHLVQNLLDSKKQLEALRQSCSIPRSVGMRLVHHEELSSEPPKGHVMFYTQILLTLGVKLHLHPWLQRMLSFIGYAPGQLYPGEPSFHQWRYYYKMRLMKACTGYAECACHNERERIVFVTRGTIKLSGRELADVEKVLRVPKEDRHLGKLRPLFRKYGFQPLVSECQRRAMEKVGKKGETNAKKGKAPMLVHVDDILFHKGARKHWAEAKAIECAAAIVAGEERRLLPHLPTINPIFPPTMEFADHEGGPSCSRKRKYKEEVGSIHWKDLKVAMRKALADAIRLKDENFESLKGRNGENVRLKKQLEVTKEQLETTVLEVSKVKRELDSALVEVSRLKWSIPTERDAAVQEFLGSQAFHDAFRPHCIRATNFEKRKWMAVFERYDNGSIIRKYRDEMDEYRQKGEAFVLAIDPSSDDDSDNEASISEQYQESEDGPRDTEEGGDGDGVETHSDIVRGSASDEDNS
ncbi:hypothetical protein ACFX15_011106 [Malus domestica]